MIDWGQRWVQMARLGVAVAVALIVAAAVLGPVLTVALAAGLFLGGRALYPGVQRQFDSQKRDQEEVRARADEQHRWASRGDIRGVYGTAGAELMRTVAPTRQIIPPGADLEVASVVLTPANLAAMLTEKPPAWRYAAFVSVLVQRRTAVQDRVRDARMGFATATGEVAGTDLQAGLFFTERLADLSLLVEHLDTVMLSPAFHEVFGDCEQNADADGIVHAAQRLMDYHDQMLALTERCRGVRVPWACADLQRDMGLLTMVPVEGFTEFIEDFADRITVAADVARYAAGDVQLDPVALAVKDDDDLLGRVSTALQRIARAG